MTRDIKKGESIGCKLATIMWVKSKWSGTGRGVNVGQQLMMGAWVLGCHALAWPKNYNTMVG